MLNTLSLGAHRLSSGTELPALDVAYATFGQLAPDGGNAVLVTHGYTSGPSMLVPGHHVAESSWAPLLGPGRPLDTDRFYEVLLQQHGTYVGPGHWFELDDRHFRLGFGWPTEDELRAGLAGLTAAATASATP